MAHVVARAFRPTQSLLQQHTADKIIRNVQMQRPFRAAKKHLAISGIKALLPSVHAKHLDNKGANLSNLPTSERVWHPPKLSGRKINVLRKRAQRDGTYGSFDAATGIGWDPAWDIELAVARPRGAGRLMALRPSKKSERQRTREQRAKRIEEKLVGMDERIEELHAERIRNKPVRTVEYTYKEMMNAARK
jgi:hypothetical protein